MPTKCGQKRMMRRSPWGERVLLGLRTRQCAAMRFSDPHQTIPDSTDPRAEGAEMRAQQLLRGVLRSQSRKAQRRLVRATSPPLAAEDHERRDRRALRQRAQNCERQKVQKPEARQWRGRAQHQLCVPFAARPSSGRRRAGRHLVPVVAPQILRGTAADHCFRSRRSAAARRFKPDRSLPRARNRSRSRGLARQPLRGGHEDSAPVASTAAQPASWCTRPPEEIPPRRPRRNPAPGRAGCRSLRRA